jgi:iron complex outermembrane recepter protein
VGLSSFRAILALGSGLATVVTVTPSTSYAQDATPQADEQLGEIIVTAQRREERLQDAPVSVTAFTADTLASQEVTNLSGIARFTPNVEINGGRSDGGGSAFQAYIRGVGQQDFLFPNEPGVGLYVDDVYYATSAGGALGLADVERIEVLRGPQGTLYGKNTIGGAIKIVTKPSNLTEWEGSLEAATGQFQRSDIKGYVSGPVVKGVLGLKLSAAVLKRDGFGQRVRQDFDLSDENKFILRGELRWKANEAIEVTLRGDYTRQRQHGPAGTMVNRLPSDVDLTGLAALLSVPGVGPYFPGSPFGATPPYPGLLGQDPTPQNPFLFDDFYNVLIVPYQNQRLGLPAGTRFDARWITGSGRRSNGTDPSLDRNTSWGVSGTVDWQLADDVSLKSIMAYRKFSGMFPRDGDHSPYPVVATANDYKSRQFSEELQLGGNALNGRLKWLIGGFYMKTNQSDRNKVNLFSGLYEVLNPVAPFLNFLTPGVGSGPTANFTTSAFSFDYLPENKIAIDTWAAFGQVNYEVIDRLNVTLGGRYSKDSKTYTQDHRFQLISDPRFGPGTPGYTGSVPPFETDGLARLVGPRVLKDSWGSFTPRVGLDYKVSPRNMLYANWSKGFKGGGWSPRPTQQNNTDLSYNPETISTFEIGSKNTFLNGKVLFNLAAFYSNYNNVQLTTIGSGATGALILLTRNVGNQRIWGLEAEFTARPAVGLEFNFAGGYLNSKWNKFNRASCSVAVFDATSGNFCDTDLGKNDVPVDAPEWTMTAAVQYQADLGGHGTLTPRIDASYRSKTWKDPYNLGGGVNANGVRDPRATLAAPTPGGYYGITLPELAQSAYWLANARLAWRDKSEAWEVAVGVTNLFNKRYFTSILPVTTFGYDEAYAGRPREWALSTRYTF